jgi:glycosyltransferase involved in cell wall biosynthesis
VRACGLGARVVFAGLQRGAARLDLLAAATVVVYASEHEVFGLVPLEALLAGTPVIVAGDSGCGEMVRGVGGGRIVPVGDAAALALAIREVLDDPARWRGEVPSAQSRIRQQYAADVVCGQLEAVYQQMVNAA